MNSLLKRSAAVALLALSAPLTALADTVMLAPNGAGSSTNMTVVGAATNWQANLTADEDTSYVRVTGASETLDSYNLENPGLSGTINSVQFHFRAKADVTPTQSSAGVYWTLSGGVVLQGLQTLTTSYADYSSSPYTQNPFTSSAWTWAEIDALQAGIRMRKPTAMGSSQSRSTRVWVVVDYTPAVVNTPPVATNNSYTTNEDTQLNTGNLITDNTGSGVDSDADGDPMTASKVSNPSNGTATVNGNGTFTYDPNADYCGADSFTYKVNDGTADSNTATVSITVTCVNDAPSFTKGADVTVLEDSGAYSAAWATAISAGPANEAGQTVSFNVSNDNNALFSSQPAVSSAGVLSFTPAADANGVANVTINIMDSGGTANGGVDTSANQFFTITVTAVNDAPSFTAQDVSSDEDAGAQSGLVVGNGFVAGPANESGQSLQACIVTNLSVPGFLLSSGPTVSVSTNECHIAYTSAPNANGSFTFDLQVQDDGGTANGGVDTSSPAQSVTVTINPVNDPPTVTYLSPASQTVDYSDYIGTVSISVTDIDDASTGLTESNEPPDSTASLSLTAATPACVTDNTLSPNPAEDGSVCSWTYDGQVLDPGDNVYGIVFTPSDGDGDGTVTGTHTLTIEPEDATVVLFDGNEVAVQVDSPGGDSPAFSLFFTAWETNDSGFPQPDEADFSHTGDPLDAADGDFTKALGFLTLSPVGPGGPTTVACSEAASGGSGYGEWTTFQCDFAGVPVNTYEVLAEVDGASATTRYYYGFDEDAFVVYDPSLGFTTAGGWFYWPGTAIDDEADPCDGYPGDKTNFGYVMKYNKKGNKVQGSALMQRHTIDPVTCFDAGSYRVKSNALYGLAIGEGVVPDNHGWAAFAGKATYREPGLDNEGNHLFFIYAEDHGEQGCGQDPSDRIWIEVWDKDDMVVMTLGADAQDDAEDIQCGNIYVPHTPANP